MSRGIDSRQPTPEHQRKRRYPLTRKRYRQPYFPFIPINSRFSLKIKPSVNLHPSPKPPPLNPPKLFDWWGGGAAEVHNRNRKQKDDVMGRDCSIFTIRKSWLFSVFPLAESKAASDYLFEFQIKKQGGTPLPF